MKNESDIRSELCSDLHKCGVLAQSIESGAVSVGIPDMYVRTSRVSAWMELKLIRGLYVDGLKVPFRPGQYSWLKRHYELGGISVLAVCFNYKAIYYFLNEHIQKSYEGVLSCHASLITDGIDSVELVSWLDSLSDRLA